MMMTKTRKRTRRTKNDQGLGGLSAAMMQIEGEDLHDVFPSLKFQDTRQLVDEFENTYTTAGMEHAVVEPMYNPQMLNRHALSSGVLRTCIDAMATNIDGFGYSLEYIGEEGMQESAEALDERERAAGLLDHPNGQYSLIDLRKRWRTDKEATGYAAMEIIRDDEDGFPVMLTHVPSYTVRMTTQDKTPVDTLRYMPRAGASDNMVKVRTRFRRYVQLSGSKKIFFREVGDQRDIDSRTGKPMAGSNPNDDNRSTDMLLDFMYAPGCKYGAPRWVGELRSVLGIQESEGTNLSYFKDNGIPAMMLMVMGGAMSDQAQKDFKSMVQSARGGGMQNKIIMVDVKGDEMAASDKGVVQRPEVRLEPLMQVRQTDAFFQVYEENASKKVRSSFRLPSMFTGLTEDVRYSVAQASLTVAESQVFGPERAQTDDLMNYQVLTYNGEPMRYWRYRSNPPRIQDQETIMEAVDTLEGVGAMTPNIAIALANEMFDIDTPLIDDEWGDLPFSLTTLAYENDLNQSSVTDPAKEGGEKSTKSAVRRRKRAIDVSGTAKAHRDGKRTHGAIRKRKRKRQIVVGTAQRDVAE